MHHAIPVPQPRDRGGSPMARISAAELDALLAQRSEALCRAAVAAADHDVEGAGWGDFSQVAPAPAEACTELGANAVRPDPRAAEIWLLERWFERAPRLMPLALCVLLLLLWGWAGSSDFEAELLADQMAAEAPALQELQP